MLGEESCYRQLALTCDLTLLENPGTIAHREKQIAHIHSELHPKRQTVCSTDSASLVSWTNEYFSGLLRQSEVLKSCLLIHNSGVFLFISPFLMLIGKNIYLRILLLSKQFSIVYYASLVLTQKIQNKKNMKGDCQWMSYAWRMLMCIP